ncbi:hypothetical protein LS482_20640 [Sinomicrobium kalidii]|uniref:hypothetical protein n=1 Tax=Sinomicrobium kalidii TaxID=2900738 RepID=UPI001E3F223F|nr:hypothetical protein [Sinomicrobium kalidii]UGU16072.1 hypothetical protein LS482_20640 [Sinomicrobium kalidii]
MSFQIQYKPLFRVFVYHGYHLNEGEDEFNTMNNEEKAVQLKDYDYKSFLQIVPTRKTVRFMNGHSMVFNVQKDHFIVGVKVNPNATQEPFIPIDTTSNLTFLLKTKDSYFTNYTNYTIENDRLLYPSNVKPATEDVDFAHIALFTENILINEDHTISPEGTQNIREELEEDEKRALLGCIKLHMQGDTPNLNILENTGELPGSIPQFKIHFDNRKTFWKYLKPSEGFEAETQAAKPLTKNGFIAIDPDTDFVGPPPGADTYRYPNPAVYSIKTIANKTYSEIFI